MTIQEKALGWISDRIKKVERSLSNLLDMSNSEIRELNKEKESLNVAKTAIQRQTATPAIRPEKRNDVYACPRCGHHFEGKPFHCNHCGQHIQYSKIDLKDYDILQEVVMVDAVRESKANNDVLTLRFSDGHAVSINMSNLIAFTCNKSDGEMITCIIEHREYH